MPHFLVIADRYSVGLPSPAPHLCVSAGSLLYPACAPADLSNDRFYNAFYAPRWQINATQYGHGDFLDDEFWALIKVRASSSENWVSLKRQIGNRWG